ncbi:hypothetical protein H6P81_004407 [Aristolochia fimbriata]|uniref:peroxidase n=1 Tax=Aristolochia fimbriata TaxID=158543 RepID=A0AAV7FFT5_ARIFI|nr:hypothetical protein H6P81_004407 [Aristolochia fimbriata]
MLSCKCRFLIVLTAFHTALGFALRDEFYKFTCPSAEDTVEKTVAKALIRDPGLGASLIRMHFHDCFVRGCHGSVLLDSLPGQEAAEKEHPANNPSLRGFEVIDEVKTLLEASCPGQVSCADILAFAARDSVNFLGGITYSVPAGRRDGNVSLSAQVNSNLPPPTSDARELKESFARKGLSLDSITISSRASPLAVLPSLPKKQPLVNASV